MRKLRRNTAIAAAAALAVAGGVIAFRRSDPYNGDADRRQRDIVRVSLIEKGQAEYKSIPTVPLAGLADPAAVREAIRPAARLGTPPSGDPKGEQLLDDVAQFIYLRFVSGSLADYTKWREARGARLMSADELIHNWDLERKYANIFGAKMPEGVTESQAFADFWNASPSYGGDGRWPVRIASVSKGLVVSFGPFDALQKAIRPTLASEMPRELWIGDTGCTQSRWWTTSERGDGGMAKELERTTCAEVGLIAECQDGSKRPLVLTFLWNPARRCWSLEWVNMYNYPTDKQPMIAY